MLSTITALRSTLAAVVPRLAIGVHGLLHSSVSEFMPAMCECMICRPSGLLYWRDSIDMRRSLAGCSSSPGQIGGLTTLSPTTSPPSARHSANHRDGFTGHCNMSVIAFTPFAANAGTPRALSCVACDACYAFIGRRTHRTIRCKIPHPNIVHVCS